MNQDIKEIKKRVISEAQREKMSLGRKAAAEKRKAEKALSKQAEEYQNETLESAKRDKENQRILKEEFARIKQRISENQAPKKLIKRLDEDEKNDIDTESKAQPELKSEPPKSPKPKIIEKLVEASGGNEKRGNWDEANKKKFDETVNNICDNMPNQKTREIFRTAVGAYDIELSLQENIKNLINECNQQIYANSEMIQKADQERKRQEAERFKKEEEERSKKQSEDLEVQKKAEYEKRLKSFYKMLKK